MPIDPRNVQAPSRASRIDLLRTVTQIPTAAGREDRVIQFIRAWVAARPDLHITEDTAGNLVISIKPSAGRSPKRRGKPVKRKPQPPLFITAHLDHPAFVVERIVGPDTVELSFRGGVMDVFFEDAPITIHAESGPIQATLIGKGASHSPAGTHYLAQLHEPATPAASAEARIARGPAAGSEDDDGVDLAAKVNLGDVATWLLLPAEVDDSTGYIHTHACDDLSAVAASLCVLDDLRAFAARDEHVGRTHVLFTRAEEIGFIGAIAAVKLGTIPKNARVLALENSRAFADSPLGGGPIVRVGDRLTVFTPWLTAACCTRAEQIFGGASTPTAAQVASAAAKRPWQRKLMAGGACEASVFCHAGLAATCLCLPLGNYHNMPHLDLLQAGKYDRARLGPPRCAREFVHVDDFHGLVDLLIALAQQMPEPDATAFGRRLDDLFDAKGYVLDGAGASPTGGSAAGRPGGRRAPGGNTRRTGPAKANPAARTKLSARTSPKATAKDNGTSRPANAGAKTKRGFAAKG